MHLVVTAYTPISVHGILTSVRTRTSLKPQNSGWVRSTYGFTLLELLVVLIIISIIFTFSVLSIRGSSPEELIHKEARRLNQLTQLAMEEAVLKNTEYGLEFSSTGYQFLLYTGEQWQTLDSDRQFRKRLLPQDMEIELSVEEVNIITENESQNSTDEDVSEVKELKPQVFLLSSEEITPEFSARFTIPGIETSYIVRGTADGRHTVELSDL